MSEKDKNTILEIAKKYKVRRVILFGSGSKESGKNKDIDLAVEGVPSKLFFKFYSELIFNLSQPVDLIDLSKKSKFSDILTAEGIQLYG
jgi:predicted nucleotidyltransferase